MYGEPNLTGALMVLGVIVFFIIIDLIDAWVLGVIVFFIIIDLIDAWIRRRK